MAADKPDFGDSKSWSFRVIRNVLEQFRIVHRVSSECCGGSVTSPPGATRGCRIFGAKYDVGEPTGEAEIGYLLAPRTPVPAIRPSAPELI